MIKNLPAMKETWIRSLGREDALEKGMGTHSSILAWKIPWAGEPGGLQSIGSQRVEHNGATTLSELCGVRDLSFPTRDQTHAPRTGNTES